MSSDFNPNDKNSRDKNRVASREPQEIAKPKTEVRAKYPFEIKDKITKSEAEKYLDILAKDLRAKRISQLEYDKYAKQIISKIPEHPVVEAKEHTKATEPLVSHISDSVEQTKSTHNEKENEKKESKEVQRYAESPKEASFSDMFKVFGKSEILRLLLFVIFSIMLLMFLARGEVVGIPNNGMMIVVVGVIILFLLRSNGEKNIYKGE